MQTQVLGERDSDKQTLVIPSRRNEERAFLGHCCHQVQKFSREGGVSVRAKTSGRPGTGPREALQVGEDIPPLSRTLG